MAGNTVDASFAGASVVIDGTRITDFIDDANPVEFSDTEIARPGFSVSGNIYRILVGSAVIMSVTVVPGSTSDKALRSKMERWRLDDGSWSSVEPIDASVNTETGSWNLTGGMMISGPGGPSVNQEGKMCGSTYTFAFAGMN